MACESTIMMCVQTHPTVAAVGAAVGFAIAKAMNLRNRNNGMGNF